MNMDLIQLLEKNALKSNIAHKISAIIVHRKKVISIGYNRGLKISSSNHNCLLRG